MRSARIKAEGAGYYHCMSRVIEGRPILGEAERARLIGSMRALAAFGGLNILAYCFLSNHFHMLIHVPERQELSDAQWLKRLAFILESREIDALSRQMEEYRRQGQTSAAEALKARFTYRMYDISAFFKAFKQQFSQHYNTRQNRRGPLWEQRFKSILVESSEQALLTMAAYIDLNPVRAGLVADPKDYRYSSYGAAMGGSPEARAGLRQLAQAALGVGARTSWGQTQRLYRQRLYVQGRCRGVDPHGCPLRPGFTSEQVRAVLEAGGQLPMGELLRCRVRYFSDGLALGGKAFLEEVFHRHRHQFGPTRVTGARPMRFGEWGGLGTLRDLRLAAVTRT